MFGENKMVFVSKVEMDPKGRIILPKGTCAEKGEVLYLGLSEGTNELQIGTFYETFKKIDKLKSKLSNTDNPNERIELSKNILRLEKSILATLYVGESRRVVIPSEIREMYSLEETLYLKGNVDVVNIHKDMGEIRKLI